MKREYSLRDVHLFFEPDEVNSIVSYVINRCPAENAEVLRKADETVGRRFIFDCRWDLESTFFPVDFPEKIDWLYQPDDDAEWTYSLNRMRYWICLGQAYAVTGKESYAKAFAEQLADWVMTVKRTDPACAPAWRTIEAGFRLEYWIKAFQYFRNSTALDNGTVKLLLDSIREHAEYIVSSYTDFNMISNWGVLANHGLFMAGLVLPGGENYCSTALERLEQEITMQVYGDGMHWEQSPMYHNEVLHDFLDVLILADRNKVPVSTTIRSKTYAMCRAAQYFQKPDHHQPMMGDSDDLDISYNISRGAWLFKDASMKACSIPCFDFDTIWDTGYAAELAYEAMPAKLSEKASMYFSESGNMVFRTGWQKDSTYVHFHCGTLGAGHGHSDQLHTDVFSGGEDILCDSGRFTYVSKEERFVFKNAEAHNTVTVDGINYCRWKDSWSASSFCRPMNQKFVTTDDYDYCEGSHTGYLQLEYGGVLVNRRIVFIKPDMVFFCDEFFDAGGTTCRDATLHTCRQYFHFSDTGTVLKKDNHTFLFSGRQTGAMLFFPDSGDSCSLEMLHTSMSRHYNLKMENCTVTAAVQKKGFCSMAACLFLNTDREVRGAGMDVKKVPVYSTVRGAQQSALFSPEKIEAWNIRNNDRWYTVVIAHTEFAAPTDMFSADGCTGFANVMVYNRTDGNRTVLLY